MINWYKISKSKRENLIIKKIKDILLSQGFFLKLLKNYHIDSSDIKDHMTIRFLDLNGKFAEGNDEEIRLDNSLLNSDNFFSEHFHFVVHEFYHWLKRRTEELFYFNDDEEIQSFTLAIAWEINNGKRLSEIKKKIFPIIKSHFKDRKDAHNMFDEMLGNAKKLLKLV